MAIRIEFSRQAEKDLEKVPGYIKIKLLSWVESVKNDGLEKTRKIPGYHDEPLKGDRLGQRSIRLSRSYRSIYEVTDGNPVVVEIREVTKHAY